MPWRSKDFHSSTCSSTFPSLCFGDASSYIGWPWPINPRPRPLLMATTLGTMTICHLVIASGFQGNIYPSSVIVGVCYGAQWSLMPTITSELFGVKHMGTIYNNILIASTMGFLVFCVLVLRTKTLYRQIFEKRLHRR
ncbi:hypothetical protein V5N11_014019 [Cardamine amara subsp. amara]|uniref:Uncharacterized protein n=1 Tax=Cardamine amara subsp. amara TaxID=228776 RepID=A0ABD1AM74_CARAN